MNPLDTIAQALPALHDDAYNPIRAASTHPIDDNIWTRPHLQANTHVTTHPHLRHSTGANPQATPTGDHNARHLYQRATTIITTAYDQLVPPAQRQRPRSPIDGPARPSDLTGMLAQIHTILTRWTDQPGTRAHDLAPVRDDQVRNLTQLAEDLHGWSTTWTSNDTPVCNHPNDYRRCRGWPVLANDMCGPCYHHDRRQQAQAS